MIPSGSRPDLAGDPRAVNPSGEFIRMADIEWVHCNLCSGKKRHETLYHKEFSWSEDIDNRYTINGSDTYDLLKCCGCESVLFRKRSWFSEDYDPETGRPEISTKFYPPPTFRESPRWLSNFFPFNEIDENISDLIREIYIALQNEAPRIAVMGIRALLETIMIDKVGDQGTFGNNMQKFMKEGYISEKQKDVIDTVLEAGHASMHRSYKPTKNDVVPLMDITENIIETIYINESKIKGYKDKLPKRSKTNKKG